MNVTSSLQMPTIKQSLDQSRHLLEKVGIKTSHLDSELVLAHILQKNRTYLHAHPEQKLTYIQLAKNWLFMKLRQKHFPIAYILKNKEFYGRSFFVNKDVLIPRPESEIIIECLKNAIKPHHKLLVDVGTGSGILGITAKLGYPQLYVTVLDISPKAIKIARKNAKSLNANIKSMTSDLLTSYNHKTDIILANLPYVDQSWEVSPETSYEPKTALYAKDGGTELIKKLVSQAPIRMNNNGLLVLEADPVQHQEIINHANKHHFKVINIRDYVITLSLERSAGNIIKTHNKHTDDAYCKNQR